MRQLRNVVGSIHDRVKSKIWSDLIVIGLQAFTWSSCEESAIFHGHLIVSAVIKMDKSYPVLILY